MQDKGTLKAVAVLRDTSTGDCFLVNTGDRDGIDDERLAEGGLELAGWLAFPQQASGWLPSEDSDDDEEEQLPSFTWCDYGFCKRMILIVDGMAPEHCTEHEQ